MHFTKLAAVTMFFAACGAPARNTRQEPSPTMAAANQTTPGTYATTPVMAPATPPPAGAPATAPLKNQPPHIKLKLGHYTSGRAGIGMVIDGTEMTENIADIDPVKVRFDGDNKVYRLKGQYGPRGRIDFLKDDGSYGLENCVKVGMRFVNNSGGDKALALKVAKLARKSMNANGAVPFFEKAAGKDNKAMCADADFKLALVSGLALPPDDPNAAKSRTLMATCWDSVKDDVVKAFDGDSKGGYVQQNTCDTLVAKKLLSGLQLKQCQKK